MMSPSQSPLTRKQARHAWYGVLAMLYVPVLIAATTHLLVYPALAGGAYLYSVRRTLFKSVVRDRYAAKLMFGFVSVSFLFLIIWLYVPLPWIKHLASVLYIVFALVFSKKLERLAYNIWRKVRSSYHM